ncbi:radical SAM protein [bacterium]|nr:radical SAM protein [candidate division CSSED10-310 bacterium]
MRNKVIWMVRPWIEDFSAYDHFAQPLGFLVLYRILESLGYQVFYIDLLTEITSALRLRKNSDGRSEYSSKCIDKPTVFKNIPRYFKRYGIDEEVFSERVCAMTRPDTVLITTGMTYWYTGLKQTISCIKKMFPDVPVFLGGTYATLCPQHALALPDVNDVIQGNPQVKFFKMLASSTDDRTIVKNLHSHHLPPWQLLPQTTYAVITTRFGCSNHCRYCAVNKIHPDRESKPMEQIEQEIEHILTFQTIRNIALYDDDLGDDTHKHFSSFLKFLSQKDYPIKWHIPNALFAGAVTEDMAYRMKQTGFVQPRLSLNYIDKRMTPTGLDKQSMNLIEKASKKLYEAGYTEGQISAYLIAGLPDQTLTMLVNSGLQLIDIGVKPYISQFSPVPGTPLGDIRIRQLKETLLSDDLLLTNKILSVYCHPGWQPKELVDLMNYWRNQCHPKETCNYSDQN